VWLLLLCSSPVWRHVFEVGVWFARFRSVLENPYFPGSVFPLLGRFLSLLVNFVSFLGSIFHFSTLFQFRNTVYSHADPPPDV
jgi:hypothetical protein